jgi:hypothetical protein
MYFQCDGVSHISVDMWQEYLNEQFPDQWIGYGGLQNWPLQ